MSNPEKSCVLQFCASDAHRGSSGYSSDTIWRVSPFSESIRAASFKHTDPDDAKINCMDMIQFDKQHNKYFVELGSMDKNAHTNGLHFVFPISYKFPKNYTILMWVKWLPQGLLTTFDSDDDVPIVGFANNEKQNEKKMLGVVSSCFNGNSLGRAVCQNTEFDPNNWMFIVAVALESDSESKSGQNEIKKVTKFYTGTMDITPQFKETIETNISGEYTHTFGGPAQGPGKVSFVKVFNYSLDIKDIVNEYYLSKNDIIVEWNKFDIDKIEKILNKCVGLYKISNIIVDMCCKYRDFV